VFDTGSQVPIIIEDDDPRLKYPRVPYNIHVSVCCILLKVESLTCGLPGSIG
jgi:hypothetical protein